MTDAQGLIKAVQNLNDDFVMYKGARFWRDAALKYLQQDCVNGRLEQQQQQSEPIMNGSVSLNNISSKGWFGVPTTTAAVSVSVYLGVAVVGVIVQRLLVGRASWS